MRSPCNAVRESSLLTATRESPCMHSNERAMKTQCSQKYINIKMKRKSAVQLGKPIYEFLRNCLSPLLSICKGIMSQIFPRLNAGCPNYGTFSHVPESWTIQKAEHQRIDAFELCWRRFLRVPWTARRLNQSILKEINPEYLMEGLMLKLKL